MAILNKYKRHNDILVMDKSKYMDIVLSQDNTASPSVYDGGVNTERCLISYIDFRESACTNENNDGISLSGYTWEDGAVNNGVTLSDIGLTGFDNGFLKFDKDIITDEEFLDRLTKSSITTDSGDFRLHLHPVDGNTKKHSYGMCFNDKGYMSFIGGFLQGPFKIEGKDYQILPTVYPDAFDIEITLRPRKYVIRHDSINYLHPQNKGIFFYIGTRSENKFAELYGEDISKYPVRYDDPEDGKCNAYFSDEYMTGLDKSDDSNDQDKVYSIDESKITDSNGQLMSDKDNKAIETDNKYLFYNRTESGVTVCSAEHGKTPIVTMDDHSNIDANLYLVMGRSKDRFTVDDLERLGNGKFHYDIEKQQLIDGPAESGKAYNIVKDIQDNAFALKLNNDGSISYSYLVKDCDSDERYSIETESTFPNMVPNDEWSTIHVSFKMLNAKKDSCGNYTNATKMRLYIYINGYLKMVSKELPALNLKGLDDKPERQEFVPYNISLGGGTQGMLESIWTRYKDVYERVLPLEKNFAGTFIGDIRTFKFYMCPLQHIEIINNYLFEKSKNNE